MENIDYEALVKALKSRRFLPEVFDTAQEAKDAALRIIGSKSVGIGGSATVRDMGLAEALQANGNEVYWHWLAAKEAKQAARDKALAADVYMCSSNALTADGRLVNIDGTGNRAAGLIYGPHEVVVILGKNKITGSLDEAIERIKRDTCPQNARRLGLDTPCAKTDKCFDCRTAARMCNVTFILEAPTRPVNAFHVLIVKEDLGL
ncbi:MAG: lactate utilization protein [Clostridia bacterium]|nr:lactate utilization protein [Clostridia bacterium]